MLVVEDDPHIRELVVLHLGLEGLTTVAAEDGTEGLRLARQEAFDLIVLDLMLPGLDGLEVCRRLRALAPVPVIMLTARGDESDRVIGLELGADDYVAKPFSPKELVARVRAVLRRAKGPLAPPPASGPLVFEDGDLRVDVAARQARLRDDVVPLTAREFELLVFLMRHPQEAFRREDLLQHVWGSRHGDTSTITVHVRRLREKVEPEPSHPTRITTVWGVGYRWEGVAPVGSR